MAVSIHTGNLVEYTGGIGTPTLYKDITVTVAEGAGDRVFFLLLSWAANKFPASWIAPTFDGATMALAGIGIQAANTSSAVYYAVAPSVGTHTLRMSVTAWSGFSVKATAFTADGVNTSTPVGTLVSYSSGGSASPTAISVVTQAGGLAIAGFGVAYTSTQATALYSATPFGELSTISSRDLAHSYLADASIMGYSWVGGATQNHLLIIPINPVVAAVDTTPPTLTSPAGVQTGSSTATGTVTTSETGGTLYWLCNTSSTASLAEVKAGSSQTVSSTSQTVAITGLTATTAYYIHYAHTDTAANDSLVASSAQFTTGAAIGDTTTPTLTGVITPSAITSNSYTLSWPAGADNIAVTGYEYNLNGGAFIGTGVVRTVNIVARTSGATDTVTVRAKDAAGNVSTPALSVNVILLTADLTAPTLTGVITASAITSNSYTLSWPTGEDNLAVTAYEYSLDAGVSWVVVGLTTIVNISNRIAGTVDTVQVRAKDAAGNVSTALTTTVALLASLNPGITTPILKNNTGTILANEVDIVVNVYSANTGALVLRKTGLSSNSSGIVTFEDAALELTISYAYEVVLTGGRRRLPLAVAA